MRVGNSPMGVVRGCIGRGTFGGAWGSVASGRPRELVGQGDQGHRGVSRWCVIRRLSVMEGMWCHSVRACRHHALGGQLHICGGCVEDGTDIRCQWGCHDGEGGHGL